MSRPSPRSRTAASVIDGRGAHRRARRPPDLHQPRPHRRGRRRGRCSATPPTFVDACRAARAAQREWARGPGAGPRPRDRAGRPAGRGQQGGARRGSSRARSASRYAESLGEVQEIVDTCDFFLGEGRRLYGQTVPSEMPDKQLFTFRMPVGVAAIITAGNFPVAVPSWYLVPALLCGNAVVWKPAEYAPALRRRAGRAVPRRRRARRRAATSCRPTARRRSRASSARSTQGLVDKVGFTGSTAVGARIGELCGRHLQSPCLELGGKNPMVVMDDADLDLAVEGALFGGFGTAGPALHVARHRDRARVDVHDEFVRRLDERAARGARSATRPQDVLYGPMIHERFAERFEDWLGLIARPPHGATARPATGPDHRRQPARGLRRRPGRRALLPPDDRRRRDARTTSSTAPRRSARSSASRRSRRFDEAMELANGHGYGLSSAIYTTTRHARLPLPRARHAPAWSRSTTRPPAPRRTCRSAATASPATARASRASGCSTSSPAGSR